MAGVCACLPPAPSTVHRLQPCQPRASCHHTHAVLLSLPNPQLLGYIKKDKQGDSLIEKLCQRFAATEEAAQWHSIAFCLTQVCGWGTGRTVQGCGGRCCSSRMICLPDAIWCTIASPFLPVPDFHESCPLQPTAHAPSLQLPLSDKGLKKLSESFRFYKHALHDEEVRRWRWG